MTVVALGELLLRLKSPGHERLLQSAVLEATIGGAEANVACALAAEGIPTAFVSAVPEGPLGDAALGELRRFGVDVSRAPRHRGRLGTYYLEAGAGQRPPRVVYDRADSTMALAEPSGFAWDSLLADARWLHVSGITPAISASAATVTLDAVTAARRAGLDVSVDFNHRAALWKWGRAPTDVMPGILAGATVAVAGREDIQTMLGIPLPGRSAGREPDRAAFEELAGTVLERFPALRAVAITLRESESASRNGWSALMRTRTAAHHSRRWEITDMVDRIGAGDAFSAGLIYGMLSYGGDDARALEFATAASCLKHTIPGDVNRVRAAEVDALLAGDGTGRVQR
ncbi:MAG: PfkB domain protein [Gemmatimonadetes bacterium]|jgi:2-dehydro-3-deoxygluconokinase|nr:PfkB domain protein [Gemmatimonadota bacterium]